MQWDKAKRAEDLAEGVAPKPSGGATRAALKAAGGYDAQMAMLAPASAPVQAKGDVDADHVRAHAAAGVAGSGGALPHLDAIQRSFGHHDVSGIQAHTGGSAAQATAAMGAEAYATGNNVAFAQAPSLHTAAHEAAHVVQQRAGVALKGGVGQVGDTYERHADAVADAVVSGRSAQGLLDKMAGNAATTGVQMAGQDAVQLMARGPTFPSADRLAAMLGTDRRTFHQRIKRRIVSATRAFQREINGSTNPDIGYSGEMVALKDPRSGKTVVTDVPLSRFHVSGG